ncbi:MAG: hypothetical protein RSG92_15380 [Pseudomonas sp.]
MELSIGDFTFQDKFDKVVFAGGQRMTGTFKPPKGRKFVVLLLGDARPLDTDFDAIAALDRLGFVPKEDSP